MPVHWNHKVLFKQSLVKPFWFQKGKKLLYILRKYHCVYYPSNWKQMADVWANEDKDFAYGTIVVKKMCVKPVVEMAKWKKPHRIIECRNTMTPLGGYSFKITTLIFVALVILVCINIHFHNPAKKLSPSGTPPLTLSHTASSQQSPNVALCSCSPQGNNTLMD